MDHTDHLTRLLSALRQTPYLPRDNDTGTQGTRDQQGGLEEMLSIPDFIPPSLRDSQDVRTAQPMSYDDLPPLEDEHIVTTSEASDLHPLEDEHIAPTSVASDLYPLQTPTPPLDVNDDPPPLWNDGSSDDDNDISSPHTGFSTVPNGLRSDAALPTRSTRPVAMRRDQYDSGRQSSSVTAARRQHRASLATPRPASYDDTGAESDSSMPSLQTVSDSSEDELSMTDADSDSDSDTDTDLDSDWDDEESSDESEDDFDLSRMIGNTAPSHSQSRPGPSSSLHSPPRNVPTHEPILRSDNPYHSIPPEVSINTPDAMFDPLQTLLERARSLFPVLATSLQSPTDWINDVVARAAGADSDPQRAETLLAGMEVVTVDLVLRYEKLRTTDAEGADGCAICRDDLVDKSPKGIQAARLLETFAFLPFHLETDSVVAFPCAGRHLFHKNCLSPWLARKTTCPTCRYDIDPHSLTLRLSRGVHEPTILDQNASITTWQPPRVESLRDWLHAEEQARVSGIPRDRPSVQMPDNYDTPQLFFEDSAIAPHVEAHPLPIVISVAGGRLVANRDIEEMHQHWDVEERRQQLHNTLRHIGHGTGVPVDLPLTSLLTAPQPEVDSSRPADVESSASAGSRDDPVDVGANGTLEPFPLPPVPAFFTRVSDLTIRQTAISEGASGPSQPIALQLRDTPLVLSPPPSNLEIYSFGASQELADGIHRHVLPNFPRHAAGASPTHVEPVAAPGLDGLLELGRAYPIGDLQMTRVVTTGAGTVRSLSSPSTDPTASVSIRDLDHLYYNPMEDLD